ncbi:MAG: hypothetical protein ACQEQL_06680 [Pseudomonadota bacterium]
MTDKKDDFKAAAGLVWPDHAPDGTPINKEALRGRNLGGDTSGAGVSADLPPQDKNAPGVSSDLPGKFNKKAGKKSKKARSPKTLPQKIRRVLLCSALGYAAGYWGYDQHLNDYQKEWIADAVTTEAPRAKDSYTIPLTGEKLSFSLPMSMEQRYELGQFVPAAALNNAQEDLQNVEENTQPLPGFTDIDFTTEAGREAAYEKTLQSLRDFENPVISTLQNVEDHATDDIAREFVDMGGFQADFRSENERVSVHAAVFLSLKLGGHEDYAAIAYEEMNKAYEVPRVMAEKNQLRIERSAAQAVRKTSDQRALIWPRAEFFHEQMATVQYETREDIYQAAAQAVLQQMNIPDVPLIIAPQEQLSQMMPEAAPDSNENAAAQANPFKTGDEVIAVNYDDQTLKAPASNPRLNRESINRWDAHSWLEIGTAAIAKAAYHIEAQRHAEKFLIGYYTVMDEEYGFGVAATIDEIAKQSGMDVDINQSAIAKSAEDFSSRFMIEYEDQTYRQDMRAMGKHPAVLRHN